MQLRIIRELKMTKQFKPRPINNHLKVIDLTGKLIPWDEGSPVFLRMPMSEHLYLPCFSTETKLTQCLERAGIAWKNIKHIDDGQEFLKSFPCQEIKIIIDPYWTDKGTVRFTEVKFN